MAQTVLRCPASMPADLLAAWHDHTLHADQTANVRAHVAGCAACQSYLTDYTQDDQVLRRYDAPAMQERIWRGVRADITHSPQRRVTLPRNVILGGLGAAMIVTILFAALFAFVLKNKGGTHSISVAPTASATTLATRQPAALSPAAAWGNYTSHTITSADTGGYAIQDIFPDGSAAVGERYGDAATSGDTVFATIAITHPTNTHVVYTTPQGSGSLFARTDGRFIAWMSTLRDSGGPGAGQEFAGYIDLQTQHVVTLVNGGSTNGFAIAEMAVDQGYLVWMPGSGGHTTLAAVNMLTGQSKTIVPNLSANTAPAIQLSYPYVFYTDDTTAHLYNLITGHDMLLAQVQPQTSTLNTYALYGATVFWAHSEANFIAVDEIDQADKAGASVQRIVDLSAVSALAVPTALAANDRLVAWSGATGVFAWDRAQHHLVAVATPDADLALFVRGTTFAFATSSGVNPTYTCIDTTTLPTTAP